VVACGDGGVWPWLDVVMEGRGGGGMGTLEVVVGDTGDVAVGGRWSWRGVVMEG